MGEWVVTGNQAPSVLLRLCLFYTLPNFAKLQSDNIAQTQSLYKTLEIGEKIASCAQVL